MLRSPGSGMDGLTSADVVRSIGEEPDPWLVEEPSPEELAVLVLAPQLLRAGASARHPAGSAP